MGRIIGIVSGKGGVGKTTVALNLAAGLAANHKRKAAVVDCNLTTPHLAASLGMHYCPTTLNEVLKNEAPLQDATYHHHAGFDVIPASTKLEALRGIDVSRLPPLAAELSSAYDFVIIDSAPGLGVEAMAAMHASQELLFVAVPAMTSVLDVVRCKQVLPGAQKTHLGLVLNKIAPNEHQLSKKEVQSVSGSPVIAEIPRDPLVSKSLLEENPAVTLFPNAPSSKKFAELAAIVAGESFKEPRKSAFDDLAEHVYRLVSKLRG